MGYALGVDVGGRTPTLAVDRGDGAVDVEDDGLPALDHLLEQVGDPLLDPPSGPGASSRLAAAVSASAARVAERERSTAGRLVVAHPAVWGTYRAGLLRSALDRTGSPATRVVPDALALATHAGTDGPGALVAVLDVREDGVTVSVVRRDGDDGPGALVAPARTVADLGAADVPDAVLAHVRDVVAARSPGAGGIVDRPSAQRLRAECERVAALLLEGVPGTLAAGPLAPGLEVRMVPSELDARLRPRAARATAAAADVVARVAPDGVDVVLVAGRLASLPLLTELLAGHFAAPLVVVRDGARAAARGAAALAHVLPAPPGTAGTPAGPGDAADVAAPGRRDRSHRARARRPRGAEARPLRVAAVAGAGALLLGVLAVAVSEDAFAGGGPTPPSHTVSVTGTPAP